MKTTIIISTIVILIYLTGCDKIFKEEKPLFTIENKIDSTVIVLFDDNKFELLTLEKKEFSSLKKEINTFTCILPPMDTIGSIKDLKSQPDRTVAITIMRNNLGEITLQSEFKN